MNSYIVSIRPEWVEQIASGKKTIEVRKTAPKEVPFKAYIYCTDKRPKDNCWQFKPNLYIEKKTRNLKWIDAAFNSVYGYEWAQQKVIGEFICDKVEKFYCASVPYKKENNLGYGQFVDNGVYKVNGWHEGVVFERNDRFIDTMLNNNDLKEMCLSAQELFDYIGIGKHLYGWHISDLKIYDKPKELSEFRPICKFEGKDLICNLCPNHKYDGGLFFECTRKVSRPPQSYMRVEELGE